MYQTIYKSKQEIFLVSQAPKNFFKVELLISFTLFWDELFRSPSLHLFHFWHELSLSHTHTRSLLPGNLKEIETIVKVPNFVHTFYKLVADIYEWGWEMGMVCNREDKWLKSMKLQWPVVAVEACCSGCYDLCAMRDLGERWFPGNRVCNQGRKKIWMEGQGVRC